MQTVKDSVTQILTDRVKSGLFAKVRLERRRGGMACRQLADSALLSLRAQDKMSYTVTPEGKAFFKKTYKVLINKGGAGEEDDGDSTMVDRGGEEGDETLIDDGDAVMDQAAEGKGLEKVRREGKKGEEDGQEKEEVEKLTLPAKRTVRRVLSFDGSSLGVSTLTRSLSPARRRRRCPSRRRRRAGMARHRARPRSARREQPRRETGGSLCGLGGRRRRSHWNG